MSSPPPAAPSFFAGEGRGGERRQLTVMFCDLVGSTALSEQLDPEDLRDVIQEYHDSSAREIAAQGGFIGKYLGDGLLVYFGYPQAQEDAPVRAIRAGLAILKAMAAPSMCGAERALVRIGVYTGLVVAGEVGSGEQREIHGIVGKTPNVAARLQSLAEPGTMVIGDTTYRMARGLFACEDLGTPELKGISEPIRVFRVVGPSSASHRLDAGPDSPRVGRASHLNALMERWEAARCGAGQVVLLTGEAGIGKSRIVAALKVRLADEPHEWRHSHGSAYSHDSAFRPVIDMLEELLRFETAESAEKKLDRLEAFARRRGLDAERCVPPLA
jgi:class 3 adenylate cyclase